MKNIKNNKKPSVILRNKDVLQSYIITTAKYEFSVYEKRILYWIINNLQIFFIDKKFQKKIYVDDIYALNQRFVMPIASILLSEKDEHYTRIKKAVSSLENKRLFYETDKEFEIVRLLVAPKIEKYKRIVEFSLHKRVYEALLNFSKGFRKYELATALSLKSVYSMRFYEIFSEQKKTITYSIAQLKSMFQLKDKYRLTKNFINRVVVPAQIELDKFAPYSFTFVPIKTRKKITALSFTPVRCNNNKDIVLETIKLEKLTDFHWSISKKVQSILFEIYNFTQIELKRHINLFKQAEQQVNLQEELIKLKERALKAKNPKGYIITSLRKILESLDFSKKYCC